MYRKKFASLEEYTPDNVWVKKTAVLKKKIASHAVTKHRVCLVPLARGITSHSQARGSGWIVVGTAITLYEAALTLVFSSHWQPKTTSWCWQGHRPTCDCPASASKRWSVLFLAETTFLLVFFNIYSRSFFIPIFNPFLFIYSQAKNRTSVIFRTLIKNIPHGIKMVFHLCLQSKNNLNSLPCIFVKCAIKMRNRVYLKRGLTVLCCVGVKCSPGEPWPIVQHFYGFAGNPFICQHQILTDPVDVSGDLKHLWSCSSLSSVHLLTLPPASGPTANIQRMPDAAFGWSAPHTCGVAWQDFRGTVAHVPLSSPD